MATGQPVTHLLDLDEEMLVTLQNVYAEQWTRSEHLLAVIADRLEILAHRVMQAPYLKDPAQTIKRMPKPEPIERPGVHRRRRGTTMGELRTMVGGGHG